MSEMVVAFLSDFGLTDEWVGVCKGVILKIFPQAQIIDISHQVPSFDVKKGAVLLANAVPYLPRGVYLAIVDPGVGTSRKAIIIQSQRGDFLVGPDNGLLIPAASRLAGIARVVEITSEKYISKQVCQTFQGRDIFAPVAAYLAKGISIEEFGPQLVPALLVRSPWGGPKFSEAEIECEIIDIDKFGTVRLNCSWPDLEKLGLTQRDEVELKWTGGQLTLPFLKTFGDVAAGEALLLIDSSDLLCLAINQGNATLRYGLKIGDKVKLNK